MWYKQLSIENFAQYALYQDQYSLFLSAVYDSLSHKNHKQFFRFILYGDFSSFSLFFSSFKDEFKIIPKYLTKRNLIKTLSQYPLQNTWIYSLDPVNQRLFNQFPISKYIFFIYLKPLRNEYDKISYNHHFTHYKITQYTQDWHKLTKNEDDLESLTNQVNKNRKILKMVKS